MTQEVNYEPLSNGRAGLACYLWGILFASIALTVKPYKTNPFVRFHAFQSLMSIATLLLLRFLLAPHFPRIWSLIFLGFLGAWITLMITAYGGKMWKIPLIGSLAAHFAGRVPPES